MFPAPMIRVNNRMYVVYCERFLQFMKIEARIGASQAIREENKFENHYIVQRRLKRSLLGMLMLASQFLLKRCLL